MFKAPLLAVLLVLVAAGCADFDSAEGGARRPAAAGQKAKAGGGSEDFEDFPNALSDEDDDLPF